MGRPKIRNKTYFYEKRNTTETVPNIQFLIKNNITVNSHPAYFVNLFLPWQKNNKNEGVFDLCTITERMNTRIATELGGHLGGRQKKCPDFSADEIMQHMSVYMINGLNPSPQINSKLKKQVNESIQGCDVIADTLGPNAEVKHKQF